MRPSMRWTAMAASGAVGAAVLVAGPAAGVAAAAAPASVVVAAAGDIACDPADYNFSGKNPSSCQMKATAASIMGMRPNYVLPLGDEQYANGVSQGTQPTLSQYARGYGASWGQFERRIPGVVVRPVAGNHEYGDFAENGAPPLSSGSNYYTFFGQDGLNDLPPSVTGTSNAWYSYDIPVGATSWHVIALDAECPALPGGCGFGSPQETWLAQDLAANSGRCILAYTHQPRWAWGDIDDARYAALWSDLVQYRATALIAGHDHFYERFASMDALGNPSPYGVAEFVVGTGGRDLEPIDTTDPVPAALRASDATHFGALKLTLQPSSASFAFVTTNGATVDSGTLPCPTGAPATAPTVTSVSPAAGPASGGTTITVNGTGFDSSATVTVAGVPATGVAVTSPTTLTAVVPAGTTTGDVLVTTNGGTSAPNVADLFTHTASSNGYSISLTASTTRPAVGSGVTLTATANRDLGPTPYFATIVDATTGEVVARTGKGNVVSATISKSAATTRRYVAQVDSGGRDPVVAVAAPQIVTWASRSTSAPTVTGVQPQSGPAAGGTTVTVTGTGFGAGTAVTFGGVPAAVNVVSPTQLTATAPAMAAGSPGTVDITVTNGADASDVSPADQFSYVLASNGYAVTLSASTSSPSAGGYATLTATANQDIGPTPYGLSIVDAATGTIIAHTGNGATVRVTITQPGATSRRYVAQIDKSSAPPLQASSEPVFVAWGGQPAAGSVPNVRGVSPGFGPANGWSTVTLTGTNFTPDAWVTFGGVSAPAVTVTSPTSLTATVPAGLATVHAVVVNGSGASPTNVFDEYTYTASYNGYAITLAASQTSTSVGSTVTLTATANQDLGPTPYTFEIFDATTGAVLAHAGRGKVITATVSAAQASTARYVAQIDNMGAGPIQAVSEPRVVSWS